MESYKIFIGVVAFNDCEGLKHTILKVKPLLNDNVQMIIKDAVSNDGTREVAREAALSSEYIKAESSHDTGIYNAMNRIIEMVPDDASLIFLGCGDYFIRFNPPKIQYDMSFGDCMIDNHLFISSSSYYKNFLTGNRLHHQSLLTKVSILKKRPFREKFRVYADYDLNLMLLANHSAERCDILSFMSPGGISSKANIFAMAYVISHHNWVFAIGFLIYRFSLKILRFGRKILGFIGLKVFHK